MRKTEVLNADNPCLCSMGLEFLPHSHSYSHICKAFYYFSSRAFENSFCTNFQNHVKLFITSF